MSNYESEWMMKIQNLVTEFRKSKCDQKCSKCYLNNNLAVVGYSDKEQHSTSICDMLDSISFKEKPEAVTNEAWTIDEIMRREG